MSLATAGRPSANGFIRYGGSVVGVCAATVLTHYLEPLHDAPTDLYFAAIVLTAWLGGKGPAILASILSTFAVDFFIIPPVFSFLLDVGDFIRFGVFLLVGLLICILQDRYQQAAKNLRQANDILEERVRERTAELAAANQGLQLEISEREAAEAALLQSEANLRKALGEKEVLFRELDHRVKNNLQVISSLLSLQGTQLRDPRSRELFKECQNRVRAIALAHQRLRASSDMSSIDLDTYFRQLVQELFHTYQGGQGNITSRVVIDRIALGMDQLVPCALIVNELVSNALKYAFPLGQSGDVRVELHPHGELVDLIVSDNGIGFSPDRSPARPGVGLQIVQALAEQLAARIHWNNGHGTSATITFPAQL
jgi:two-component sensor histidine kinase